MPSRKTRDFKYKIWTSGFSIVELLHREIHYICDVALARLASKHRLAHNTNLCSVVMLCNTQIPVCLPRLYFIPNTWEH